MGENSFTCDGDNPNPLISICPFLIHTLVSEKLGAGVREESLCAHRPTNTEKERWTEATAQITITGDNLHAIVR